MHVVMTGGGTGGHVYPALAVLEAWASAEQTQHGVLKRTNVLFVGTHGGLEEQIVSEHKVPFKGIQAGALRGKSFLETAHNLFKMVVGFFQSLKLIADFKPRVILATGGYVCAPVVLAAKAERIPVLIYLPDVEPGWAIKFLSRFADKIAVSSEESLDYLPRGKTIVTGYPVRDAIGKIDPKRAKLRLALEPDTKTLLVLGGSRGAHSINEAIAGSLDALTKVCQIIHASGQADFEDLRKVATGIIRKDRYHLYEYLDSDYLPLAMAAADLVVSRAGASTMGEFPAAGLPSILIPYPYAGAHQDRNAEMMVKKGTAVKIADEDISHLPTEIERLIGNENLLLEMSGNARQLHHSDAAGSIAGLAFELASKTTY